MIDLCVFDPKIDFDFKMIIKSKAVNFPTPTKMQLCFVFVRLRTSAAL